MDHLAFIQNDDPTVVQVLNKNEKKANAQHVKIG